MSAVLVLLVVGTANVYYRRNLSSYGFLGYKTCEYVPFSTNGNEASFFEPFLDQELLQDLRLRVE